MTCWHGYTNMFRQNVDDMFEKMCSQKPKTETSISDLKKFASQLPESFQNHLMFFVVCFFDEKLNEAVRKCQSGIREILNFYSNLEQNNLETAKEYIDKVEKSYCGEEACEWTAFHHRALASWNLQMAWTAKGEVQKTFKSEARKYFQKCVDQIKVLCKKEPTCHYLQVIYIQDSTNIIFLHLKLCWFLFSRQAMILRFDRHRPERGDVDTAEKLIDEVEQQIQNNHCQDSVWYYQAQYPLLLVNFFYCCRKVQEAMEQHKKPSAVNKDNNFLQKKRTKEPKKECDVTAVYKAHDILQKLETEYLNETDTLDMLSDLLEHLREQVAPICITPVNCQDTNISTDQFVGSTEDNCSNELSDLDGISSSGYSNGGESDDCGN